MHALSVILHSFTSSAQPSAEPALATANIASSGEISPCQSRFGARSRLLSRERDTGCYSKGATLAGIRGGRGRGPTSSTRHEGPLPAGNPAHLVDGENHGRQPEAYHPAGVGVNTLPLCQDLRRAGGRTDNLLVIRAGGRTGGDSGSKQRRSHRRKVISTGHCLRLLHPPHKQPPPPHHSPGSPGSKITAVTL